MPIVSHMMCMWSMTLFAQQHIRQMMLGVVSHAALLLLVEIQQSGSSISHANWSTDPHVRWMSNSLLHKQSLPTRWVSGGYNVWRWKASSSFLSCRHLCVPLSRSPTSSVSLWCTPIRICKECDTQNKWARRSVTSSHWLFSCCPAYIDSTDTLSECVYIYI